MTSAFFESGPFIELPQAQSTNNYAIGAVHAGMAQHGMAVFTHHQTAGKGQRQKQWLSEAGKNIAMSVVLQPPGLALSQSFLLSAAVAVAIQRFFSFYAGDETKIKWPNDVYWRDRKAAGILIENVLQGAEWKAAVIGTGININQTVFETIDRKAVSLKQITGKEYDPLALAKELHRQLLRICKEVLPNPKALLQEYSDGLYKRDQTVRLKQGSRVFEAKVKAVTALGEMVVQHSIEEKFVTGEVEWLI